MKGFIIIFLGLFSCIMIFNKMTPKEKTQRPAPMERVTVELAPFHLTKNTKGFFKATQHFKIQSPVIGEIEHLLADVGDRVTHGQTLAWIADEHRAQLLKEPGQMSQEELIQLNRSHPNIALIAPFDGVILTRPSYSGKIVDPKTPVFTLAKELRVTTSMKEADYIKIKKSTSVWIRPETYPDLRFDGKVIDVRRSNSDPELIDVTLRVDETPEVIQNEMPATVEFVVYQKENATLVPNWLVHGRTHQHFKILAEDRYGDVIEREVFLGRSDGVHVEILSPVAKNTVFFYQPPVTLSDLNQVSQREKKE